MKEHLSIELLERYINGECTDDEVALVKQWYQSFEHDADYTSNLNASQQKELEEKIYNSILKNIDVVNSEEIPVIKKRGSWVYVSAVAAMLLIALMIGLYRQTNKGNKKEVADDQQNMVAITNNSHRIYKSKLPDGSMVWLNPNSQLKYPKVFAASSRMVFMSGECFFEVTKNPDCPFIINSHSIITKVWGTSFRVRDNEQSNEADVAVVTGKVSVSIKTKQSINNTQLNIENGDVMLYPHQKAIYSAHDHTLKPVIKSDESTLKIWNHEDLLFDNKLVRDIIPALNARYKTHIVVANEKLNHYMLNADFTGFNLPDVLEALNKSLSIDYEIKNNTIELK
ncbi:FecR family protein [Mucilaginibacter sp. HC2]|uniref:FecR family protein n=1 Tax=Mucilaginibacter inviolabilis TaxID=2714892 RepID=UPI001408B7DC|nr:FecR family protein [Mucilaginibacter inviolabilis]NHA05285.1 FecR family protein [Mucilaginibacter inviolabilis]